MKKKTLFTLLLMMVAIALAILFRAHNQDLLLQGEVDAPEVIVASKAKGRVVERLIERGDDVKSGQLIIQLDSPELMAQLRSAQATRPRRSSISRCTAPVKRASATCAPIWRRPKRSTAMRKTTTTAT